MRRYSTFTLALLAAISLTSCAAAGTVFEAGKWWGILIAAVVIGLFLFLFRGRNR